MHLPKLALLAALGVAGAFVACTLNPQPLPPDDERSSFGPGDASGSSDSGSFTNDPLSPPNQDAGAPAPNNGDGGTGGDGDGGDAGDAGPDGGDAGDAGDAG
jgi:hypothetical protein